MYAVIVLLPEGEIMEFIYSNEIDANFEAEAYYRDGYPVQVWEVPEYEVELH